MKWILKASLLSIIVLGIHTSSSAAGRQDEEPDSEKDLGQGWANAETEHYQICGETGDPIVKQYKVLMELLFTQYSKAFKFTGKLEKKARVFIHKDRDSYVKAGGPGSSVAYYNPKAKRLVSYENAELLQFLAHEATHQFFDLAFPSFFNNKDLPMWFSEGIAECFCNCRVDGPKTLSINVLEDCENAWRNVTGFQDALQDKQVPALQDMLNMSHSEFMTKGNLMYPVSWSFCHFLWNYPGTNEGKGNYREVIIRLVEAFKDGKKRDEAYDYAFRNGKKKLDLTVLDSEWKGYGKALRAKRPSQAHKDNKRK